jgi:tetratricopeptide (TPR) repeat protein
MASPQSKPAYKKTLFDRHGPGAVQHLRAFGYGLMVFGLVTGTLLSRVGWQWWVLPVGVIAGAAVGGMGFVLGELAGGTWKHFVVDGASTPYKEQYSYQQALVMRGQLDEALESFEAVIAEKPQEVDPRTKAAELYAREKKNHKRAAELFREIQRIETVTPGEYIYATNRLVDLLTGPLNDPGRALVELRRLIDRYPESTAANHAREALAVLKARVHSH